jgi:Domain of Unknown Function (DUF1543)
MPKLFMLLLGASPQGRNTEQHDVFFGIGEELRDLVPAIYAFWPEAKTKLHIDAWREVTCVNGYSVKVLPRTNHQASTKYDNRLFFINLGGYKSQEFDEYHYKMIVACAHKGVAIQEAKQTAFYKHTGCEGASSHIDDKYGVDVDDLYEITDILPADTKDRFSIMVNPGEGEPDDEIHLGYFKLEKL